MLSIRKISLAVFILASALAGGALGQDNPTATPKAVDNYVTETGFKNRVFEVKNRDPESLFNVLRALGSGFKGATMAVSQEFKTLTVRDLPENLAVIEEALKRLDTPEPSRPGIEFRVYVLMASNSAGGVNELPADLNAVIQQVGTTLNYKNYSLMTSAIHRAKEGSAGVNNRGVAEYKPFSNPTLPNNPIFYEYGLTQVKLDSPDSGSNSIVQIGAFNFDMRVPLNLNGMIQYQNVGFRTPVSLRAGEKVVVGTTTVEEKGLIVVLTATVVK